MARDQFLEMARNLARYHREHEKFYARAPLEEAASLQRTSAALRALAERWSTVDPSKPEGASPFSGAEDLNDQAGDWLASAMETSWGMAEALLQYPELADLLSERHRIISNDWHAASLAKLVARNLDRARAILESLDFSPAALRKDLQGARRSPAFLHSACDLIDHGSDLAAGSAALVHENERRWRVFRQRIDQMIEPDE